MKIAASLVALSILAAPAAIAAPRPTPDEQLARLLAGRVAGTPRDCIPLTGIQSSQIIQGQAIVYRSAGRLWVNRPQIGAEQLDRDDILVTQPFGSQLCRVDTVRLVDRATRFQRGFVGLGDFVPYDRPKTKG